LGEIRHYFPFTLVCINLHTFYETKTGQKRPKTVQICQIYVVFCVFECAGTDMKEKGQNQAKTDNTSTGLWKERSKAEAGEEKKREKEEKRCCPGCSG
jgi:hypothetical protein